MLSRGNSVKHSWSQWKSPGGGTARGKRRGAQGWSAVSPSRGNCLARILESQDALCSQGEEMGMQNWRQRGLSWKIDSAQTGPWGGGRRVWR